MTVVPNGTPYQHQSITYQLDDVPGDSHAFVVQDRHDWLHQLGTADPESSENTHPTSGAVSRVVPRPTETAGNTERRPLSPGAARNGCGRGREARSY
jgi:mitochondrial fission protein ELM1